jgi:hypothetical protein
MDTRLVGELIKLRYKLMWARTRTRNGKIALFFVGYLLLILLGVVVSMGGFGAGIAAVKAGKAHLLASAVLGVIYIQALMATVILGFGLNAVFADAELRRYPVRALERLVARQLIGIADPFWFLVALVDFGLVIGLYVLGPGSVVMGLLAALLLLISNYVMAEIVAVMVERLTERKGGSALLLLGIMSIALLPALIIPNVRKHQALAAAIVQVLHYTPPYGAASAMLRPGIFGVHGLAIVSFWLAALVLLLLYVESRPHAIRAVETGKLSWSGPCERLGALFGPRDGPLVANWLRFYSRNNRFRTAYPLAMPIVGFLVFTQTQVAKEPDAKFATILGCFALVGFVSTAQFAVNQFGYLAGGYRRYFLLPTDPAALLRTGSYKFVLLSAILILPAAALLAVFSPIKLDGRMLAMLVSSAFAATFIMHGVALWATLFGPRRGNYKASFGNDLSLAGNIVFIGGMLSLLFGPRALAHFQPSLVSPDLWWIAAVLVPIAAIFYFVSLRMAGNVFRTRREQILAVVEGRA